MSENDSRPRKKPIDILLRRAYNHRYTIEHIGGADSRFSVFLPSHLMRPSKITEEGYFMNERDPRTFFVQRAHE